MVVSPTSQNRGPQRLPGMRNVPFEVVVAEHGDAVLRVCRAMLPAHEASDAWSETFLSALRSYPQLDDEANVRAWLLTIARRRSIDQLRARGRRAEPTDAVPELATASLADESLPDDVLLAAVRGLPPRQRAAVAYRYLADLSYQQVGELLGSSPDAARRSAADGIAALRARTRTTEAP